MAVSRLRRPFIGPLCRLTCQRLGQLQTKRHPTCLSNLKLADFTSRVLHTGSRMAASAEEGAILSTFTPANLEFTPGLGLLKNDFDIVTWPDFRENQEQYLDRIKVILTYPMANVPELKSEELLRKMTNLRAVTTFSIGLDHLDLPLLKKLGIRVGMLSSADVAGTTADHAFTLMLTAARRIPELIDAARGYNEGDRMDVAKNRQFMGVDVHERTLGIIGMGEIGYEVALRAKGFKMKVLYHNRNQRSHEDEKDVNATYCPSLSDLLPNVDFLVISAPLNKDTLHMMSEDKFLMMKPTAIVINIARGGLVDTDDLVDALRNKVIMGAALDVTDPEPLPDHHPLLHLPNAIVVPHIGMNTSQGIARIGRKTAENVRAAMEDRQLPSEFEFS